MHMRWITFFCRKFHVWQCQKKHRHPFNFSEIWGNRKTLCIKRVSQFPAENCSSHSAENFCGGILLFLRKILVSKSFYGWRGGGSHDISPLKKMVSQCRKNREHPCNNSEKLSYRKKYAKKGVSRFSVENFRSDSAEKFRGHPSRLHKLWGNRNFLCKIEGITFFRRKLSVSQCGIFWRRILLILREFFLSNYFYGRRRGRITFFHQKNLVSQSRKFFWASLQSSRKIEVTEKFMYNRGYHVFLSKLLGLTVPHKFVGIPSVFQKVWGNRNILCIIEGMTYFRRKFSVSQCRKFLWVSLQCFGNFRYRKISCIIGGFTFFCRKFSVSQCGIFWRRILLILREFLLSKRFYGLKRGVSHFSVEKFWSHRAK